MQLRTIAISVVGAVAVAGAVGAAPAAAAGTSTLASGHDLTAGQRLTSGDGRYVLAIAPWGQARLMRGSRVVWATPAAGTGARLRSAPSGDLLLLRRGGQVAWKTNTRGAGAARLTVGDGVLTLATPVGTAWSSVLGNGCRSVHARHQVTVDLSRQRAWLCAHGQQILTTPVTTGASALGDATPIGTWQVYSKVRNTTLYPAGGGAYHVHYWMPYSSAYGMHDSPWQHFAYGSSRYRTHGSHGCVHFPAHAMARLFGWAPVGATVQIHR